MTPRKAVSSRRDAAGFTAGLFLPPGSRERLLRLTDALPLAGHDSAPGTHRLL
jgi:hypothetical protein